MIASLMPHPLVAVLEESGWHVREEKMEEEGVHVCHAWRGKYHLIGEGANRAEAQVDTLSMLVELEWERCLEPKDWNKAASQDSEWL